MEVTSSSSCPEGLESNPNFNFYKIERLDDAPKIQRLVTPRQLQRKRVRVALKRGRAEKNKKEQAAYLALVAQRAKEAKERRHELLMKRRSSHGSSHSAK